MADPSDSELRQIKRILWGILVCLIIIVMKLVPPVFSMALVAAVVVALLMVLLGLSEPARAAASKLWVDITSLWQRHK